MANKLYVAELSGYAGIGSQTGPWVPNPIASQICTVAGAAITLGTKTKAVLLITDTACCFAISDTGVADNTTGPFLPANVPLIVACSPGQKLGAVAP